MGFSKCHNCKTKVPVGGQCGGCGFVHGINRPPTDVEFLQARRINDKHDYEQFINIDMKILEHEAEFLKRR